MLRMTRGKERTDGCQDTAELANMEYLLWWDVAVDLTVSPGTSVAVTYHQSQHSRSVCKTAR